MAKVVVSPSVHNFADIRPVSRGLSFSPRPKSRLSTGDSRPGSGVNKRTEYAFKDTPRSQIAVDIPLPNLGRRSLSVSSLSSNGKSNLVRVVYWLCFCSFKLISLFCYFFLTS